MNEKIKESIMNLYNRGYRVSPYQSWRRDLFDMKNSHQEITNYIYDRFKKTTDVVEYYTSMVFLAHVIPDEELFIPYQESPQHQELLSGAVKSDETVVDEVPKGQIQIMNTINQIRPIGG